MPKTQPHLFFREHRYSLYIDNTVVFKRLPQTKDLAGTTFRAFRHPWRSNPTDEADIVAKNGLDLPGVIAEQFRIYQMRGLLAGITTLTAGTVLLRDHHSPAVQRFGQFWWQQVLAYSKRDQLSLDVCAKAANCPIEHFPGDKRNNDLFVWPALLREKRVLGSFDDAIYGWVHRNDPTAAINPRAHFLAHHSDLDGQRYARRTSWFEYLCDRTRSSLGSTIPPKRDVASILDQLLDEASVPDSKILVVGIASPSAESVDQQELADAKRALKLYYRFSTTPLLLDAMIGSHELDDTAPFQAASGHADFKLVIVLGVPVVAHKLALAKFLPLLAGTGKLLVQFHGALQLGQVSAMRSHALGPGELYVYHRRGISAPGPIASSTFLYASATPAH